LEFGPSLWRRVRLLAAEKRKSIAVPTMVDLFSATPSKLFLLDLFVLPSQPHRLLGDSKESYRRRLRQRQ
jgi:hypothetical protein